MVQITKKEITIQKFGYKSYDILPVFLNAEMVARILAISNRLSFLPLEWTQTAICQTRRNRWKLPQEKNGCSRTERQAKKQRASGGKIPSGPVFALSVAVCVVKAIQDIRNTIAAPPYDCSFITALKPAFYLLLVMFYFDM